MSDDRDNSTSVDASPDFLGRDYSGIQTSVTQLQELLDGARVGEIDGVHFDLRHEKLPASETWHAPDGASPFGIVFPWDTDYFDGDPGEAAKFVTGKDVDSGWITTHVQRGDKVTVKRVVVRRRGLAKPPYVDHHDNAYYAAYLTIQHVDGSASEPDTPICWNARDAMGPHSPHIWAGDEGLDDYVGDYRVSLEKIKLRIDRLLGSSQLAPEWQRLAEEAVGALDPDWGRLRDNYLPQADDELDYLLDMAAAAGYALAKIEAAPILKMSKTRTTGAVNARKALTAPISAAAKDYMRLNPNTSLGACARHLSATFSRDQRQMERLISRFFEPVETKTGVREKRPRSYILSNKFSELI